MYLVLSALTSSPISLVAATTASAFSFRVCKPLAYNTKDHDTQIKNFAVLIECETCLLNHGKKKPNSTRVNTK